MALFLTVSRGDRAGLARPIMAISDPRLVAEMIRPLGHLLSLSAREAETPKTETESNAVLHPALHESEVPSVG